MEVAGNPWSESEPVEKLSFSVTHDVSGAKDDDVDSLTQTRFNFYDAEEVNYVHSKDKGEEPTIPTRFNFYDAEEMHKKAPLHLPVPIDLTQRDVLGGNMILKKSPPQEKPSSKTMDTFNINNNSATTDVGSTEILRSLQETERERNRGRSNPYEAAIQDALAMLRKSSGKTNDKILDSRESTYSEARDADERAREERMAKYAARLVELEGRPLPSVTTTTASDVSSAYGSKSHVKGKEESNDDIELTSNEFSSVVNRAPSTADSTLENEEIQRGVERVLMAILERAHSTSRERGGEKIHQKTVSRRDDLESKKELTNAVNSLINPGLSFDSREPRVKPPSRRVAEEYLSDDEDNENYCDGDGAVEVIEDATITGSQASGNKRSVVDDLLAEVESTIITSNNTGAITSVVMPTSPQSPISKLTTEPMVSNNALSNKAFDEAVELEENKSLTQLLGPLSGNDETGVVLEGSVTKEEDTGASDARSSTSILESLSTAVKDAESFMSFMTGAGVNSPEDNTAVTSKNHIENELREDESFDGEANELMRSLCAHLLPYGVDKSTKHLSEIPPWDDRNRNEPGYRIIRLSKAQLKRVEREFERMVNIVKRSSEINLVEKGRFTSQDVKSDWNGISDDDGRFEKDLEEAEDLLDREEKMQAAVDKSKRVQNESESSYDSDGEQDSQSEADDVSTLSCHPEFPGVRQTGRGEMGDLEYFNLPIIYKSHVTGFEPTKDLYLEPGNVVAGQYLVENELGSAAFSTAYRCIDLNSDSSGNGEYHEEVCLKVIKNTKDFFDQSLDEIKILELLRQTGRCNENNIVEMKKFFYHREHLVIVTELLRQNLFEFGKFIVDNNEEPYFTLQRLCYLTRQVLVALNFVHSLSLVHSDVKPENILLSSYSRAKVKLIDFGSSCYLTDRQSSYIQSRSYRAPEVVLGLPYDGKIDVWSLGCVVAEMFTGEVTFQNDSIVSMLSRIEAICGPFPRHMIAQGRQSNRFFTKSGLLYELVEPEENRNNSTLHGEDPGLFDVFQPKRTTLASRLGFDPKILQRPVTSNEQEQALFVDFCQSLLTIDPDSRPTAAQALQHPWIITGTSQTEDDIKYPSH
mmetsp:Transcript_9253/g.10212  ORF Transcript_9253/g.10212 Transcript_9253/m.10212 type:complete len:1096 (-) Transcript_9253:50-3337(-)|eukprot:CAMPEP_0194147734 /NCGR_PEP_ID=MMETSP0152-20130528/27387_1 /TAXON_ID=1049557 /ORGANISM="Thalassiothrix antarctica, Strain L6-D1" /LENGTH=1095 /DNA_ID=CAMNT_0038848759 /DNA_START=48 /DNA_END=3335 /DNA_ORIENTATION=+